MALRATFPSLHSFKCVCSCFSRVSQAGVEFRFKHEAFHQLKEDGVFHGIEDAGDLPERLEVLWTYAAGHADVAADGLPDGWLRYMVPSSDTNMARWPVHPAWLALQ